MKVLGFFKLLLFISLLIELACTTPKTLVNNWQDKPIIADGNDSDWNENVQYDTKSKFWYKLSNDDQNLYIMLKTEDESLKRKILMVGLTVWIDPTNHKKEKLGIHYPKGRDRVADAIERSQNEVRDPDRAKERLFEELQVIELIGFNGRDKDIMMIGDSKIRPAVAFGKNNALIYECVLPLSYIFKGPIPKDPTSIGFVTGHREAPNNGTQNRGYGGRMGGRGGMGGMGGMGGGRYGGSGQSGGYGANGRNNGNNQQLSETTKCWIKNYSFIRK